MTSDNDRNDYFSGIHNMHPVVHSAVLVTLLNSALKHSCGRIPYKNKLLFEGDPEYKYTQGVACDKVISMLRRRPVPDDCEHVFRHGHIVLESDIRTEIQKMLVGVRFEWHWIPFAYRVKSIVYGPKRWSIKQRDPMYFMDIVKFAYKTLPFKDSGRPHTITHVTVEGDVMTLHC